MSGLLIKVCGLTLESDLLFCQESGVDLTGFIFHPESPRFVSPDMVGSWKKKREIRVGVFVRHSPAEIIKIIDRAELDLVQLHGDQKPEDCMAVGKDRVIRAFWPERFNSLEDFQMELELFRDTCRYFLFDSGKSAGGHGRRITSPWIRGIDSPRPFFLAGGLGPDNAGKALNMGMAGIDLNSGVEKNPGRKDWKKIEQVINILRVKSKK